MRKMIVSAVVATLVMAATANAADAPKSWDGLVEVKSAKMEAAFLMPGADFRPYTKVMLDQPEVAFQKDWLRNMNDEPMMRRVTAKDAQKILASVQTNTSDVFTDVFNKAGLQVVTEPGADVLRVRSAVAELYVSAPDVGMSGFTRTFTANAGEATLILELRDSVTNALMGRVVDRQEAQGFGGMRNSSTNLADYRELATRWAKISVKGLQALQSVSPIPADVKPGQKLN